MIKKWYDVTRALSEKTPVFPGDIEPRFTREEHGSYIITGLCMSTHSGTHIDAPAHYLKNDETIDLISITSVVGKCRVINLTRITGEITPEKILPGISGAERVLLHTGYKGTEKFDPGYTSLGIAAAQAISAQGVRCVGIDSPSIEAFDGNGNVHLELLGKGIVIIEFLDLSHVPEGEYYLIALPLRLQGLDGSPARVVLCKDVE
jgi:arylformamidase